MKELYKKVRDFKNGDIVFVDRFKYSSGDIGKKHMFLIINDKYQDNDNNKYLLGLLISSQEQKEKYNDSFVIKKDWLHDETNLTKPSHVKLRYSYYFTENYLHSRPIGNVYKVGELNNEEMFDEIVEQVNYLVKKHQYEKSMNF